MTEVENQFEKINSVKVIIENKEGKILLIQESADDAWMPLHWGLPGGRPQVKESLYNTLKRKVQEGVGIEDVENMYTSEFTAFYAKKLILDSLSGNREFLPFDIVETQQYYDLDQDPEFQKWLESGKKKS